MKQGEKNCKTDLVHQFVRTILQSVVESTGHGHEFVDGS